MKNKSKSFQKLVNMLTITFFLYLGYGLLFFLLQRSMLFPTHLVRVPKGVSEQVPDSAKIWIETEFGISETWYLTPFNIEEDKTHPIIIIGHGNGDLIDNWIEPVKRLREVGIGILLVEYPGYGRSTGKPTQESITKAFVASYDSIRARLEIDPKKIILLGHSVGGGAVCALAKERPSAAIILISAFTSVRIFASNYFLPKFLVRDPFDNLSLIKIYENPVLIVHGRDDRIIPYKEGKRLYAATKNGKMISKDGGHNNTIKNWRIFWDHDVLQFLENNGLWEKNYKHMKLSFNIR